MTEDAPNDAPEAGDEIEALRAEVASLRDQIAVLTAERDKANRKIARMVPKPKAPKSRTIKRLEPLTPDARRELAPLLTSGEEFEIVFVAGTKEQIDIPAIGIAGDAWDISTQKLRPRSAPEVTGRPAGGAAVQITGFALFDGQGFQIAFQELPDPITIPAGGRVKLERTIGF